MDNGKYSLDNMKPEQRVVMEYFWRDFEDETQKKRKKKKKRKSKKHKKSKKKLKMRLIEKTANTAIDTTADILRMYFKKKFNYS